MSYYDDGIEAEYPGRCSECGGRITPGDLIHSDYGDWVHVSCDEALSSSVAPRGRPTLYEGIQMRSRLEAGFAQSLDLLGLQWEYEPQAFASRSGQYLPDFLVRVISDTWPTPPTPTMAWYIEVKPSGHPHVLERMKIIHATVLDAPLCVMHGAWEAGRYGFWPAEWWPTPPYWWWRLQEPRPRPLVSLCPLAHGAPSCGCTDCLAGSS